MSKFSLAISIIFAIIWSSALYFDFTWQPRLGHDWYIYKLIMLTNINFVLDTIYSVLVVISYKGTFQDITDFMFFTSVFPIAVVTSGLFWGLYAIEPELVMPAWVARLIPSWLNHVTHTLPIFYVLLETRVHKRKLPTKRTSFIMSCLLVFFYFVIIFAIRYIDGFWIYPLLQLFNFHHFVLAYIAGVAGFFSLTQLAVILSGNRKNSSEKFKSN
ncbi:unnamed protein product [Caenorhabditis bovis]|uniref:FAR-17a/AIG1-like protein n=1 Tax=Caenorhabditis bovis TaxID=2654633 RepID=A0A8S1EMQ1_9PELO|nr:unnamed protein product [Caenorhabditis bovis]